MHQDSAFSTAYLLIWGILIARQLVYAPKYEVYAFDRRAQTEVPTKPDLIVDITDDCQNVRPGNRFVLL